MDPEDVISLVRPDNFRNLLRHSLEQSGFFGARFRECAGRALLLTRARFNQRLPLWMSRLQAKKLMTTVSQYADFPVLLETWRTCLDDEFDLDRLEAMLGELADGVIGWSFVSTATPSPFAANITFDQINRYMYADDSPDAAGPSSLSDRLIADVLANEQLRPRISLPRSAASKRSGSAATWTTSRRNRRLAGVGQRAAADPRGRTRGSGRRAGLDQRWPAPLADPPGAAPGAVGLRPGGPGLGTYGDPVPPVPGSARDAVQLATEMLSFYGPRTLPEISELLPSVPEGLFRRRRNAWITGSADRRLSAERYYCDAENYEILLRFQRAALRPEVVAQPASRLPAMLARWQGFRRAPG